MPTVDAPPFRLTPQRAAILDVVRDAHDHPTARDIYRRVRARMPGIGFATVYRSLNLLAAHGEILELQLGDGAVARYDGNTHSHDHVTCVDCGVAADIAVALPQSATRQASAASGFEVFGYELQFRGRCANCTGPAGPAGPAAA